MLMNNKNLSSGFLVSGVNGQEIGMPTWRMGLRLSMAMLFLGSFQVFIAGYLLGPLNPDVFFTPMRAAALTNHSMAILTDFRKVSEYPETGSQCVSQVRVAYGMEDSRLGALVRQHNARYCRVDLGHETVTWGYVGVYHIFANYSYSPRNVTNLVVASGVVPRKIRDHWWYYSE
jgi:hypothetical protein